jgi:hypothetical protein
MRIQISKLSEVKIRKLNKKFLNLSNKHVIDNKHIIWCLNFNLKMKQKKIIKKIENPNYFTKVLVNTSWYFDFGAINM